MQDYQKIYDLERMLKVVINLTSVSSDNYHFIGVDEDHIIGGIQTFMKQEFQYDCWKDEIFVSMLDDKTYAETHTYLLETIVPDLEHKEYLKKDQTSDVIMLAVEGFCFDTRAAIERKTAGYITRQTLLARMKTFTDDGFKFNHDEVYGYLEDEASSKFYGLWKD